MNDVEARKYGRQVRKWARDMAAIGDIAIWASEPDAAGHWLGARAHKLGIVGSDGMIDTTGPVARAFCAGFRDTRH